MPGPCASPIRAGEQVGGHVFSMESKNVFLCRTSGLGPANRGRQQPVKRIGEALPIGIGKRRRPAGHHSAGPQPLEQVSQRQTLSDVFLSEDVSPRVDGHGSLSHHLGRQRDIRRHHDVSGSGGFGDVLIGCVEIFSDLNAGDERPAVGGDGPVGHEGDRQLQPFGGPEDDLSDGLGAGIGVNPDPQDLFPPIPEAQRIDSVLSVDRPA